MSTREPLVRNISDTALLAAVREIDPLSRESYSEMFRERAVRKESGN